MLTFEDFFVKKKIDLNALKQSNLPLYEEFKSHYNAMGEKSFDHSKKFWFNKLRKSYRLQEVESAKLINTPPTSAMQPDMKKGGESPVLVPKTTTPASKTLASATEPINEEQKVKKPTGFKPRFKAGTTKSDTTEENREQKPEDKATEETPAASKPAGFKPRFKAAITKSDTTDTKKNNR
ncbi:hypothetical protein [Sphingobacterium lumbrici]|uniref:hypothetical protein n=1 Tax=Sphingobacterium lumbrici TaxID=2559600 RepID=UPI00112A791F|nr:hypothetical protein [Sphingobacterium lumbrici]